MTIRPNEEWGSEVPRPEGLRIAVDDADLARRIADDAGNPVAIAGGDLHRTLGARTVEGRATLRRLPIDTLRVTLDGSPPLLAVAHVVVRTPSARGGWWRGPVSVVMNAEFIGEWDVAPRGHPNDGRAERFELDAAVGVRQRLAIARRLRSASHLPHPGITRRSAASHVIEHPSCMLVVVDGRRVGRARRIEVEVVADGASILA